MNTMIRKPVVVGVDGSDASVRAATAGAMIARRAGVPCFLVHAMADYQRLLQSEGLVVDLQGFVEGAEDRDLERIRTSLAGQVPDELLNELVVEVGGPAVAIRRVAQRLDAGLIVLGAQRHRGPGWRSARLARHLVRSGDIPVLVTAGESPVIQQVLVALDLSFASGHTCAVARQWAELFGAQLRVIHVEEPLLPAVGPMMPLVATLPYQRDLSRSDFWNALPVDGKVVRSGEPAEAIAAEAIQSGADLLVVGSHGHGWSDRLLLGGTAEVLLQRPPAMTLVVPSILPGPAHTAEASALSLAAAAAH